MNSTLGKIVSLLARGDASLPAALDGFVDSLLQTFENCRPGLSDEVFGRGAEPAERYFTDLYEKEIPRLAETIRIQEPLLTKGAHEELFEKVDSLVRGVLIPAYVRVALRFTARERNDFYLLPDALHGLERLGWGLFGMAIGAFIVWAPFIPLWSKEWILPFAVAGLFFPNLRRFLAHRRYESELNALVGKADREISRMDAAYLTSGEAVEERGLVEGSPEETEVENRRRSLPLGTVKEGGS